MPISVLILTFNEEKNLRRLLGKIREVSDDIVILDSQSTDGTLAVAEEFGCRVKIRPFDNEKSQRDFGNKLGFVHEWVYNPDADEIPSDQLISEMISVANDENDYAAYEARFKNYLDGKWIKRSTDYPVWVIRFFRPALVSFDREINLAYRVSGKVGKFRGHFYHYPFSKGLEWWLSKHNVYSTKEALEAAKVLGTLTLRQALINIIKAESSKARRLGLKELSFLMPGRAPLRFIYSYLFRMGFLDGRAGLKYCILISFYEYLISEKLRILRDGSCVADSITQSK